MAAAELWVAVNIFAFADLARSTAYLTRCTASAAAAMTPPLDLRNFLIGGSVLLHVFV